MDTQKTKTKTKPNRLHLVVAIALVGLLATVAYAATINRTFGPHDWIRGEHRFYTAGAGRTFSIDIDEDSGSVTLKGLPSGLPASLTSDPGGTMAIADRLIAGDEVGFIRDFDSDAMTGTTTQKIDITTQSDGTYTGSFGSDSSYSIKSCTQPVYAGGAERTYAPVLGYTDGQRTFRIKLGGGMTGAVHLIASCDVNGPL